MAVARGACRGRALRRPRMLHLVRPVSYHVRPYTFVGLQRMKQHSQHPSVAASLVPNGQFGFAAQDSTVLGVTSSSKIFTVRVGPLGSYSI